MKKLMSFTIAFCIFAGLGALSFRIFNDVITEKAFADAASLTATRPSAGDIVTFIHSGQMVATNWSQLSRQLTQDINWVGLSTTTGAINWNYIGQ